MAGRYDHIQRPDVSRTWCGLPWYRNERTDGKRREPCPECVRKDSRSKGGKP